MQDMEQRQPTPEEFMPQVRHFAINACYSKAFDMYIYAFEKWPQLKTSGEAEFRILLENYNAYLLSSNKIGDIFYNFERSIECFPGNMFLLNDIGRYLYKFGYLKEACSHFQKALNINVGYVSAEKSMNSVKNVMVARWHFRMLNDKLRNSEYRRALRGLIRPMTDVILDIGTGTGILAMYANECNPVLVAACDGSECMTEIAGCVFEENEIDNIMLLNKISTSMDDNDLGGKRTMIVTELFDAGIFGEHILQTLEHALVHLLAANGRVLPARAEFFVAGAKCDFLGLRYRLNNSALRLLNTSSGQVHLATVETYDSEDVHLYEDIKYITEPKSLLKINFSDLKDIQDNLNNEKPIDTLMKAKEDGEIDVIIGWFDLYLTENIVLTTNPKDKNRANAWQQAVFYDFIPKAVKKDDSVLFQFSTHGGRLSLFNEGSDITEIERISPDMIRFLNDNDYIKVISSSIGTVFIYLTQIADVGLTNLLDMNPFPVLGLLLMKRGIQNLTCYAKNEGDKKFILKVFRENGIPEANITVIYEDDLSIDCFKDQKFHLIFSNLLELCGDLNVKQKQIVKHLKLYHLATGGLVLPFRVTLQGQLVYSNWLEINNLVSDANVPGYSLAKYINKFQVSQNFHVDISHLEYRALTEVTEIAVCSEDMPPKVIKMKVISEGLVNSILCWYTIELIEKGEVVTTKRADSYIDCTAFRAHPKIIMTLGKIANILRCVDEDDSYKLITDIE